MVCTEIIAGIRHILIMSIYKIKTTQELYTYSHGAATGITEVS